MDLKNSRTVPPRAAGADWTAMFRALAHPTRMAVFQTIRETAAACCPGSDGTICACDIGARLGISASMVSHHLRELRLANLVRVERRGAWVHCSVNGEALEAIKEFAGAPPAVDRKAWTSDGDDHAY